jgi:sugar transferase (PEP-CTERM/EpsH1 system associated)
MLTPGLPYPPEQGRSVRNYNLLRYLATRHRVSLLSFAEPGALPEHIEHLRCLCERVETLPTPRRSGVDRLRTLLNSTWPDMAWRLASQEYAEALKRWLAAERFDVLQVEGIELARYLLAGDVLGSERPLIVFDDHNAEYLLQKRAFLTDLRTPSRWPASLYSLVQWLRLRSFERRACRTADRVVVVSEADAAALRALDPTMRPAVVPNGVDLVLCRPGLPARTDLARPYLVFVGKMDFRPNVDAVLWFAERVLPHLWSRRSDVRFCIVGQSPSRRLDVLRHEPRITITGRVEDPRPYIAGADLYVVPLRVGGGTRLKVLEAMAMGQAIISTGLGVEGLGVTDGQHLLLADDPRTFAARILELLDDPDRRRALGAAARAFAEERYGWERIGPLLEAVYRS